MKKLSFIILIMCSVLAAFAQGKKNAKADSEHNYEVQKQLETFTAIYKHLDMAYVDTLDPAETVGRGINAMLRTLDPYTTYYAADETKDLRTMLTGKYAGIGAIIRKDMRTGNVVIDEPYENMPAAEAGLRKGDIILAINDSVMTGKDVSYVSEHLRGDAGTTCVIKVQRSKAGNKGGKNGKGGSVFKVKLKRRAIQLPCVPYYGMLGDGVGYLYLTQFTEDCSRDVRRALVDLRQQGMKRLVFDLRNNGGGALAEAVKIVNMFVPRGITLVTTKGKLKRSNNEYKAEQEPLDTIMPTVILVNGNTASASEITAGSLQDLDRAVIMGTRTYGKGLVQQTVDLPYGGTLKFTISKYYIPSGRCIQAINYKHSNGGYREHIPDSLTHEFKTRGGRIVRDGGGIKPDVTVKADSLPNIAIYLRESGLDSTEVMFDYVVNYINSHKTIAPLEQFHLTDADYAEFKQQVISSGFKYDRESVTTYDELVKTAKLEGYYDDAKAEFEALKKKLQHNLDSELDKHRDVLQQLLEREIITAYYYQKGEIARTLTTNTQVLEAKKLLLDDARYAGILKPAADKK